MSQPKLVLGDRLLAITGLPESAEQRLCQALSYIKRESHFDPLAGKMNIFSRKVCLYERENGKLIVPIGYQDRVLRILKSTGLDSIAIEDKRSRDPSSIRIDESVLQDSDLRPLQKEILEKIVKYDRGMFQCPTGSGKSYLLSKVVRLFPDARIDIVTRRIDVAKTIFRYVSSACSAGIICSDINTGMKRVNVFTVGSLHRGSFDADILIADEVHELATEQGLQFLARYKPCRAYAFSATVKHRFDRSHNELEGIFGPIRVDRTYTSSQEEGSVVPIMVVWFPIDKGPRKEEYPRLYKRYAIWTNVYRNKAIAQVTKHFYQEGKNQTMVSVETVEHAFHLRRFLPEFEVICSDISPKMRKRLLDAKLATEDDLDRIASHRHKMRKEFEQGKLRGVIATDVWSTGVSFNELSVLVRADASSSGIKSVQIPGRVARVAPGKEVGIVVDFDDRFDPSLKARAADRRKIYASNGWTQISADDLSQG